MKTNFWNMNHWNMKLTESKITYCLIMMCCFFFFSCDKNEEDIFFKKDALVESSDEIRAKIAKSIDLTNTQTKVEHATLEEINEMMRKYGLAEITEKEVKDAKKFVTELRSSCYYPCTYFDNLGDWSGNGVLSVYDIVLGTQYRCFVLGDCDGSTDLWATYNLNHPDGAWGFSILSWYAGSCTNDGYILDTADFDIAQQYVLANLNCY